MDTYTLIYKSGNNKENTVIEKENDCRTNGKTIT